MTAYGPNERVAQVAHEILDPGPMGWDVRREDYRDFINANFEDSRAAPVFGSGGTNCAIFVRGCWVQAGIMPKAGRPKVTGITSWLGVGWFSASQGFPAEKLERGEEILMPGDCLYWCGGLGSLWSQRWKAATNGHVGIVGFDGEGWLHTTYEGGGKNHLCRKSAEPKDVRESHNRPLRWVWRPAWIKEGHDG